MSEDKHKRNPNLRIGKCCYSCAYSDETHGAYTVYCNLSDMLRCIEFVCDAYKRTEEA